MTLEQIIALLVAKFQGVRKDGLAQMARTIALQATTEEEAQAIIDKLDVEKVKAAVTDFRKDVDKEVSEANKTFESGLKKKFKFVPVDSDPGKGNPNPTDPNDFQAAIKAAMSEVVKPLQDEIASLKGSKVTETRLQQLEGLFPEGTPETFKTRVLKDFNRMSFDDDTAFNEYLNDTKTDLEAFNQELANNGLSQHGRPAFSQTKTKEGVSTGVAEYIANQTQAEGSLGGKEV